LPVAPGNCADRQALHPQQWSLEVTIMTNKSLIAGPTSIAAVARPQAGQGLNAPTRLKMWKSAAACTGQPR